MHRHDLYFLHCTAVFLLLSSTPTLTHCLNLNTLLYKYKLCHARTDLKAWWARKFGTKLKFHTTHTLEDFKLVKISKEAAWFEAGCYNVGPEVHAISRWYYSECDALSLKACFRMTQLYSLTLISITYDLFIK